MTFHYGQPWNAAAAALNFDHILVTENKYRAGFHDWYGLPAAIRSWEAVGDLTFRITFNYFYEAAFRELSMIRPFRFASPRMAPRDSKIAPSSADRAWRHAARTPAPGAWDC